MITPISRYAILLLTLVSVFGISCKKETGATAIEKPGNFNEVFDQFWNNMNQRYVFWNEDSTNWNEVRKIYKPLFGQLDFNKLADLRKSVQYFREMTSNLMDGHYHIEFTHPDLKNFDLYPSRDRKRQSPWYHNAVDYTSLVRNYLDPSYAIGATNETRVMYGTINNQVLYFSCSYFYLFDAYHANNGNSVRNVLEQFFGQLSMTPSPYKGIIIDVRNNGGGDISDLNFLMGRMISARLPFGSTRYKTGPGKLDYTPWIESFIMPLPGSNGVSIPLIALADNFSASMAESVTMAIMQTPGGKFIGEPTWGANGPYASNKDLYNAGPFELNGFMKVQTSSAAFRNIDGVFTEKNGIIPDLFVPFDQQAVLQGRDLALEAALEQLQ